MPYISKLQRQAIAAGDSANTPGQLNYVITEAIIGYMAGQDNNYSMINEVVGVLECAKLELYRRIVIPYEDRKIEENGDVYG